MAHGAFDRAVEPFVADRVVVVVDQMDRAGHGQYIDQRRHAQENRVAFASGKGDHRHCQARREDRDPERVHRQHKVAQADERQNEAHQGADSRQPVERAGPLLVERGVIDRRPPHDEPVGAGRPARDNFVNGVGDRRPRAVRDASGTDLHRVGKSALDRDFADAVDQLLHLFAAPLKPRVEGNEHGGALVVGPDQHSGEPFHDQAVELFRIAAQTPRGFAVRLFQKSRQTRPGHDRPEIVFRFLQVGRRGQFVRDRPRLRGRRRRLFGRLARGADVQRRVEPVFDLFDIEVGDQLGFGRGQREIVDRLARNQLLGEELDLIFMDFAFPRFVELAAFPADDNVAFEGKVFQEPPVIFRFLKPVGKPVLDRVRVALECPPRTHQNEAQKKDNDEDNPESVYLVEIGFHRFHG